MIEGMIRASSVILYLGLGLTIQVVVYGDMTFRTLSSDANLSTWAHILAWPLFLFLLCGYYFLWFLGLCVVISIGAVGWLAVGDWRERRQREKLRHKRT